MHLKQKCQDLFLLKLLMLLDVLFLGSNTQFSVCWGCLKNNKKQSVFSAPKKKGIKKRNHIFLQKKKERHRGKEREITLLLDLFLYFLFINFNLDWFIPNEPWVAYICITFSSSNAVENLGNEEKQRQRVGTETESPRNIFLWAGSLLWDKEGISKSV